MSNSELISLVIRSRLEDGYRWGDPQRCHGCDRPIEEHYSSSSSVEKAEYLLSGLCAQCQLQVPWTRLGLKQGEINE